MTHASTHILHVMTSSCSLASTNRSGLRRSKLLCLIFNTCSNFDWILKCLDMRPRGQGPSIVSLRFPMAERFFIYLLAVICLLPLLLGADVTLDGVVEAIKGRKIPVSALKPFLEGPNKEAAQNALYSVGHYSIGRSNALLADVLVQPLLSSSQKMKLLEQASIWCIPNTVGTIVQNCPDLNVSRYSNRVIMLAARTGMAAKTENEAAECVGTYKWLKSHKSFRDQEQVSDILSGLIVRELSKDRNPSHSLAYYQDKAKTLASQWGIHFDYIEVAKACLAPQHEKLCPFERMLSSALLDRHGYLFPSDLNGGSISTRRTFLTYFPDLTDVTWSSRPALFTQEETDKLNSMNVEVAFLKDQAKFAEEYLNLVLTSLDLKGTEKDDAELKAEAYLMVKTMELYRRILPGVEMPLLIAGIGHGIIATFKKDEKNHHVGTYKIYNTGDGTIQVDEDGRIVHWVCYENVPVDFFYHVLDASFDNRLVPVGTKFTQFFYPDDSLKSGASERKIKAQLTGSCAFRSITSYLLGRLDRSLYLKVKIAMHLDILAELYHQLDVASAETRNNPRGEAKIIFEGKTYEMAQYPVWVFLRQSGMLERKLLRQAIRHFSDPSMANPLESLEACTEYIRAHCQKYQPAEHLNWKEWSHAGLLEDWMELAPSSDDSLSESSAVVLNIGKALDQQKRLAERSTSEVITDYGSQFFGKLSSYWYPAGSNTENLD